MYFGNHTVALALGALQLLFVATSTDIVLAQNEVTFPHDRFEEAIEESRESFGGEVLLYYYRPGSALGEAIKAELLEDESLSAYINANFARYAVDILSDSSTVLQQTYGVMGGKTNPGLKPAIAVISLRNHDVHLKYWEERSDVNAAAFQEWLAEIKGRD